MRDCRWTMLALFTCLLRLLKLNQSAGEVHGVQEDNWLAVGADAGLARAGDGSAHLLHAVTRRVGIAHFVADMVHAATGVLLQELCDRRVLAQWSEQFDLSVGEFDKDSDNAMLRQRYRLGHLRTQNITIDGRGLLHILRSNGHVVQPPDHVDIVKDDGAKRQAPYSHAISTRVTGFLPQASAAARRAARRTLSANSWSCPRRRL